MHLIECNHGHTCKICLLSEVWLKKYFSLSRDTELAVLPDGLLNTIKRHFPQVRLKRRNYKKNHLSLLTRLSVSFSFRLFLVACISLWSFQGNCGARRRRKNSETHLEVSSNITLKFFIVLVSLTLTRRVLFV